MTNQLTASKEWEAFGSKELVFGQHLDALDRAQENLARMIALHTSNQKKDAIESQIEFITFFIKTLFKARIKITKYNQKDDIEFSNRLDKVLSQLLSEGMDDSKFPEFVNILYKVGILYDKLGYNSPERLKMKSNLQSDLQIEGMETPEYAEPVRSGYDVEDE